MRNSLLKTTFVVALITAAHTLPASEELMQTHCADCHNDKKARGEFNLNFLGNGPTKDNFDYWLDSLDYVSSKEMPPEEDNTLSPEERQELVAYLKRQVEKFEDPAERSFLVKPRRLNNREFANSVRDVLLLEHVGTNQPMDNLIGDSLHQGFDTHSDTLGFSRFHLEQYLQAVRNVVDAVILTGEAPETRRYEIGVKGFRRKGLSQNISKKIRHSINGVFDFHDPKLAAYFADFPVAPESGRYKIKIRCVGKDRKVYDDSYTGRYHGDPIQLNVHLGNQVHTFDLLDEEEMEIEVNEWLGAGTRVFMTYPTDAFRERGNGNFKFQYFIASKHLQANDPAGYKKAIVEIEQTLRKEKVERRAKRKPGSHFTHWIPFWEGARPRLLSATVEGPFYESWPSRSQQNLLGKNPTVEQAEEILRPIATRAWRRPTREGELDAYVQLVKESAKSLGTIEAFKEGIISILVSPQFLLLNADDYELENRFASKFSYLFGSTIPSETLKKSAQAGLLDSFEAVQKAIENQFQQGKAEEFMKAFPYAWLRLADINFMGPDPDHYPFYHRKSLSDDMINEALAFFRHAIDHNIPLLEFLSADYSFVNADLAKIYGVKDLPKDSKLRKYTFQDGRRGGLLGMGAFLTVTADSLSTSPIHRAVYVMENFLGIHPKPPPGDVLIEEPDVRQARTMKEILATHTQNPTCASCHATIDPYGYAFENFGPTGAWRDFYTAVKEVTPSGKKKKNRRRLTPTVPIDSSSTFRNGTTYKDIIDFRKKILTPSNRDRFVRSFISKLLLYANGVEPTSTDYIYIDQILAKSAEHDYRIIETIAATIDSPLFRERLEAP